MSGEGRAWSQLKLTLKLEQDDKPSQAGFAGNRKSALISGTAPDGFPLEMEGCGRGRGIKIPFWNFANDRTNNGLPVLLPFIAIFCLQSDRLNSTTLHSIQKKVVLP
jgi:hypothetical protein